ncbi:MAG: N-acetylmuramoyl-L-alanine amidase [Synergistaceae bacterium]|nr:N-acetylmuramoyl-L-alanine amidase [Synergistaceae bacterium]
MSIIPLYSEPFERNGKLWLDSSSIITLFQAFAGSGQNNRLRFNKNAGYLAQKVKPDVDVEYKKPDYTPTAPAVVSLPKAPAKRTNTPAPTSTPAQAISAIQSQAELPAAIRTSARTSDGSQPRLETFRPNGKKTEKGENYSGTIRNIRWTASGGRYQKILAVVETDNNADPQVYISGGKIHALFAECPDNAEGLTSPYENVKTTVNRNSKGVELVFTPSGFTKAEKLVLNNPRRIAFDFYFPSSAKITGTSQPSQPAVQTQRHSQPTVTIPTPTIPTTPRRRSPAVTTPPSTITIPTTPAGVRRKTVVIDPGHGGKDPGASANGVVEKNVTLAIGLELQNILAARGYRVVMTRNSDTYPTLQERTDIANRENADLFVSVHVNALPSKKSMTGFEIYIMALPTDKDAMNLAKIENREYIEGKGMDTANVDRRTEMLLKILGDMQQNNKISESTDFAAALYNAGAINGLPMRRIAQAPFFVLRGAGMPAVLLETGFVTNAAESRLLATRDYQQKIAQAMASGIMNYLR